MWKSIIHRIKSKLVQEEVKKENFNAPSVRENVFGKDFSQRALLSFLTQSFDKDEFVISHSNLLECYTIAEVLNELEYKVDVVNYDDNEIELQENYDLIIGFGQPIENLLYRIVSKSFKLILYRNGSSQEFSDEIALKRLNELYKRKNKLLVQSARIYPYSLKLQHNFADKIIVLGNETVANTYNNIVSAQISRLNLFYFNVGVVYDPRNKDIALSKQNFLWFGSAGAVHKGLDLLLDFFQNKPDLNLFICGLGNKETNFLECFADQLKLPNVYNYNFVDISSDDFKQLIAECGAVILPTISEGGGGAILNVVAAGGLVPIVSPQIGLDFGNEEILIEDFCVNSIENAIEEFRSMSEDQIRRKSINLQNMIRIDHTFDQYKEKLKNEISQL